MLRSVEQALGFTSLDRLYVVYPHDPDYHWRQAAHEAVSALAELHDHGVIGALGDGMNQSALLAHFLRETTTDMVMLAECYSVLNQSALDDVLPAADELGKSVGPVGCATPAPNPPRA